MRSLKRVESNKLSLLDAIRLEHLQQVLSVFDSAFQERFTLEDKAKKLIEGMIASHRIYPGLTHVLLEQAPRSPGESVELDFEKSYRARFTDLIRLSAKSNRIDNIHTKAFVLSSAVEGMIHEASQRSENEDALFRDEIARLVLAYLYDLNRSEN
jgi:hypothetical protein